MHVDAMTLRDVDLPKREVVFFKSLIEAYPGVAAVHATRRDAANSRHAAPGGTPAARLIVATSRELTAELDGLLADLANEIDGLAWNNSEHSNADGDGG
jgi:hypothetical protein